MSHHPFLVGRNHQYIDTAVPGTDMEIVARVGFSIQTDAQPLGLQADAAPDFGGVLADATRKHQRIEAAGCRCQRAQLANDTVAEEIDGFLRFGLVAGEQGAHILGDTRDAEQTRLLVEHPGHFLDAEAFGFHQVQHDPGVEIAAARSHHQSIDGRKPQCGTQALASDHRRHAGTVAEMRNNDAPLGAGGVLGQRTGDVFVGKPMKTVALDAFGSDPAWQAEHLGDGWLAAMEGGIEAGDLRHFRQQGLQGTDAGDVVRLVQGRQRNETVQVFQYLTVNNGRLRVKIAAMDDTMANGDDFQPA